MVSATTSKCILIVDGNQNIRTIIRGFLESETGLRICGEAVDGYDAVEKAQQLKPDLIILDISLPRMDGIRTASVLKKMHPRTPIILFTLYHDAFNNLGIPAGFDAVVPKDRDISLLMSSVQSLLHEASPQLA
jgi:two-component system, chemotaxis family, protein-glutamate methylesterase/glutaminase